MIGYMHSDFFPKVLPEAVLGPVLQSPRYGGQLREYVRHLLKIDNLGWYDFSERRYWLCLLSADEIQRIIGYIGGICFSEQIRKIILSHELLKLKGVIGNEAYLFALRSAPLLLKSDIAERFQVDGETIIERVLNTGKSIIEMSLAGVPKEIAQRFLLKFPRNFGWNFKRKVNDPHYYFDFIQKIIKWTFSGNGSAVISMIVRA
jgi:hypothetical protein